MSELPHFSSRAFLAPMAGVSDPALRLICKNMGAGLVITELTSIHAIIAKEGQLKTQMKNITEFLEFSGFFLLWLSLFFLLLFSFCLPSLL